MAVIITEEGKNELQERKGGGERSSSYLKYVLVGKLSKLKMRIR